MTGPLSPGNSPLVNTIRQAISTAIQRGTDPNTLTTPSVQTLNPPPLKTFVYAPQVRIVITHDGLTETDVSADLVSGDIIRKENGASTLLFKLANKGLRYTSPTPMFQPMDRVIVYMKRTDWVQVFSGYLDTVGYVQLYPGTIDFKATCTLKRLKYTWWNPNLPASQVITNSISQSQALTAQGQVTYDSGIGGLIYALLTKVGNWNGANIHIQNFPTTLYNLIMTDVLSSVQSGAVNTQQFKQQLLGDNTFLGVGQYAGASASAGQAGPMGIGQPFYLQEIVTATDALGMGPLTTDLKNSQQLTQAATSNYSFTSEQAWAGVASVGTQQQTQARNSDAAILAVACALAESGMRNLTNPTVPQSYNYIPNDGDPITGGDHSSVGLFQQQSTVGAWGTVAQEMNPRQSATMFLTALNQNTNWRNQDPASAIAQVQGNASGAVTYAPFLAQATTLVQAYRKQYTGLTDVIGATPGLSTAVSAVQSATMTNNSIAPGPGALAPLTNSPGANNLPNTSPSIIGPNPNSEGAINYIMTFALGKPYVWGASGPAAYDCSGLLQAAFRSIGVEIGRTTFNQQTTGTSIPIGQQRRGDAVQIEAGNHTVLWMGDGTILEAATEGVPVHRVPAYFSNSQISGVYRYCDNGGVASGALFNPAMTAVAGTPPGALTSSTGALGGGTGGLGGGQDEAVARNVFSFITGIGGGNLSGQALGLPGERAFVDGNPLMQSIQAVCRASLRNFASAPNGDFIAYYPDYWGLNGTPAILSLEDIELKNFVMQFSDDPMATHVYINGNLTPYGNTPSVAGWLQCGAATVDNEALFKVISQVAPGNPLSGYSGTDIMNRFGIRPLALSFSTIGSNQLEYILAAQIFMEHWAQMFQAKVEFTFLPELFPGMRLVLANHGMQCYVSEVNHHFDFESGFTTSATLMAPSQIGLRNLLSAGQDATATQANATPGPMDATTRRPDNSPSTGGLQ